MDKILQALKEELDSLKKKVSEKKKDLLELVVFKGEGFGFYYCPTQRNFLRIFRKSEMYLLPQKTGEEGKSYVFLPNGKSGIIILVPTDEIKIIGFN